MTVRLAPGAVQLRPWLRFGRVDAKGPHDPLQHVGVVSSDDEGRSKRGGSICPQSSSDGVSKWNRHTPIRTSGFSPRKAGSGSTINARAAINEALTKIFNGEQRFLISKRSLLKIRLEQNWDFCLFKVDVSAASASIVVDDRRGQNFVLKKGTAEIVWRRSQRL